MKQFTEEMTPVRIVDRGQSEGSDTFWRVCVFGGDPTKTFRVSVTEHVIEFLKRASYDYDVDDIAVAFIEMAHEQGHKGGDFIVAAKTVEYDHLISYIQKIS